ncbi:DUF4419 domain-containing protein [Streptomyces sp. NPDC003710]
MYDTLTGTDWLPWTHKALLLAVGERYGDHYTVDGDIFDECTDVARFLRAVLRDQARFHHRSTDRLVGWSTDVPEITEPASSLLLRAVHLCFTAHLPLSLSPDMLWYAVVHEVAVHVRLNSGTYAITVRSSWGSQPGKGVSAMLPMR